MFHAGAGGFECTILANEEFKGITNDSLYAAQYEAHWNITLSNVTFLPWNNT